MYFPPSTAKYVNSIGISGTVHLSYYVGLVKAFLAQWKRHKLKTAFFHTKKTSKVH